MSESHSLYQGSVKNSSVEQKLGTARQPQLTQVKVGRFFPDYQIPFVFLLIPQAGVSTWCYIQVLSGRMDFT